MAFVHAPNQNYFFVITNTNSLVQDVEADGVKDNGDSNCFTITTVIDSNNAYHNDFLYRW